MANSERPKRLIGLRAGVCLAALLTADIFLNSAASAETFQEALMSAYTSNPSLMAERARVRETDENFAQAKAQGRLTSNVTASAGYAAARLPDAGFSGPSGTFISEESEPQNLSLQVIQPIYQGGRVNALKKQAKASILSARESLRNAEQTIMLNAASAYINVIASEDTADIRRNNVRVLTRQLTAAEDRFDVGEGTRTDIAQAQTRLAAAEIGLAQADSELQSARATYRRVVGHLPVDLQPVPEFILPGSLPQAIALGRENNPQLIASLYNEQAADHAIDVAKAASRPTVSINGTFQGTKRQVVGIERQETATIAAQVRIPILTGGLNQSRVRAAKHAFTRSKFETRNIEQAVDQAIAQTWAELVAAERSMTASRLQVESAEFAFEGVKLEQQIGTRSTLDVLNAEQELLNARLSVITSRTALEQASLDLLTIMGAFDANSLQLPVDLYDPADNFKDISRDLLDRAVDDYVPEAVEKIAKQVPNIPKEAVGFGKEVADFADLPEGALKVVKQVPDIPHDAAHRAKTTIDNLTGQQEQPIKDISDYTFGGDLDDPENVYPPLPVEEIEARREREVDRDNDGLADIVGNIGRQLPNIPSDAAGAAIDGVEKITGNSKSDEVISEGTRRPDNYPKDIEGVGDVVGTIGRQIPNIPRDIIGVVKDGAELVIGKKDKDEEGAADPRPDTSSDTQTPGSSRAKQGVDDVVGAARASGQAARDIGRSIFAQPGRAESDLPEDGPNSTDADKRRVRTPYGVRWSEGFEKLVDPEYLSEEERQENLETLKSRIPPSQQTPLEDNIIVEGEKRPHNYPKDIDNVGDVAITIGRQIPDIPLSIIDAIGDGINEITGKSKREDPKLPDPSRPIYKDDIDRPISASEVPEVISTGEPYIVDAEPPDVEEAETDDLTGAIKSIGR